MLPRSALALALVVSVGCFSVRPTKSTVKIPISATPAGTMITMTDDKGSRAIGVAPVDAEVKVVRNIYDFNPVASWLLAGTSVLGTAGFLALAINPPDETVESTGTIRDSQSIRIWSIVGVTLTGLVALLALPAAIAGSFADGREMSVFYEDGAPTFSAKLPGYTDATAKLAATAIPPKDPIRLELLEKAGPSNVLGALVGTAIPSKEKPVLAVFDLDGRDSGVPTDDTRKLSEYLSAQVAGHGHYRVVPRAHLKKQLTEQKAASYKSCFDESCQIELGKAVAAEKTLATKIIRVGDVCALSATVFDLRTEAAEAAQTVRTPCTRDQLMDAIDKLAAQLE